MTTCRECGFHGDSRQVHAGLCWTCEKRHLDATRPRRMSYGQLLRWASDCPYIFDGRRCLEPARHGIVHRLEKRADGHPVASQAVLAGKGRGVSGPETRHNGRRGALGGRVPYDSTAPFIPPATGEAE